MTADEKNGAALRATQRRDVYLTGFGKFGDIVHNPTTFIVEEVAQDANVTEALVLEVSADGSLDMLAPLRLKAEERGRPCIFLHLGVAASAIQFRLERVGYNLADFRIPDERGWVAKEQIIDQDEKDALETALPLDDMVKTLQENTELVGISTDPGRYICNYVYFHSLQWVKKQLAEAADDEHHALFVHVPPFDAIPQDAQVAFIREVIAFVANL